MLDEFIRAGTLQWWVLTMVLWLGRGFDLGSTWLATPNLRLEANPISRRLGWRGGLALNFLIAPLFACWPPLAISLATTSTLLGARNSQQIWLMRSLGEDAYRDWIAERVAHSRLWVVRSCFLAEAFLTALIGGCLMVFSAWALVPFSIGLGILGYSFVIAVYTTLSLRRRHPASP